MRYIRRIMRISWTEKKSNEEVMEMVWYERFLLKKTTAIFWPIKRADGLEKQILVGKICGAKSRKRQYTKYTDSLNNYVMRKKFTNNKLIGRTVDREEWKAMMANIWHMIMIKAETWTNLQRLLHTIKYTVSKSLTEWSGKDVKIWCATFPLNLRGGTHSESRLNTKCRSFDQGRRGFSNSIIPLGSNSFNFEWFVLIKLIFNVISPPLFASDC